MKPNLPLKWIGTTKRSHGVTLFHLESGTPDFLRVACGCSAKGFTESFLDAAFPPHSFFSVRCVKCESLAKAVRESQPIFCRCPNDACMLRESIYARSRMVADLDCPSCGRFKLSEFLPVPR